LAVITPIVALALAPGPAAGQALHLAPDAEVHQVEFRFSGKHELSGPDLSPVIATTGPDMLRRLHQLVAWIPFVADPKPLPFVPLRLQEDVVRLRQHYRRQGFPSAIVDYEVETDRTRSRVDVTFLITEGRPLLLRSLKATGPGGADEIPIPADEREQIRETWAQVRSRYLGKRMQEQQVTQLHDGLIKFLADRGYSNSSVVPRAAIDSVAGSVDMIWELTPGQRTTVSSIDIEGVTSVPESIAERQLGFEPGEWTSKDKLERGRANLLSVELFRSAEVSLASAAGDTAVPVKVVITEDRPRLTTIEAGYVTDGAGITGQARWTHPNFTGGARSLNTIALFQSGWGSTSDTKDRLARATIVLNQPYVWTPDLSLGVGPTFEFRDGNIDRSVAYSAQSTLVWRFNPLQSAALRYEFTYRQVDVSRALELTASSIGAEALADSLSEPVKSSLFSLSTSLGGLDDIARPQRGLVLKPYATITAPSAFGTIEFARLDLQATTFVPMPGRSNALMLRANAGGLWPFGKSIPSPGENPVVELARLRDYIMTAGGANDVRGYQTRMLGPKTPRVEATLSGTDTILVADDYIEFGGLRRWTATAELRLGMPWVSRNVFAHVFSDAGRVWTTDSRFQPLNLLTDEQHTFYTTGGGIGYYTPVGAIRFDVGYKLNPSPLDLRNPQDVVNIIAAGQPIQAAPINNTRRYGFHFALGLFF
jgi:outer membrane protein assembly factor BamA